MRSLRTRLEIRPSADQVPKLFCERIRYWPQGSHRKGKSSSSGALFDPFMTNSRQTLQELNSSTLAEKAAKKAALSTRSFPGARPTPASREISPIPGRDASSGGRGPRVHSPLLSAAWKAREGGLAGGESLVSPTAPGGDSSEEREGTPDRSGRGWSWQGRSGKDRRGPSARRGSLLTSSHVRSLAGTHAGAAVACPLPLSHYLQDHQLHAVG